MIFSLFLAALAQTQDSNPAELEVVTSADLFFLVSAGKGCIAPSVGCEPWRPPRWLSLPVLRLWEAAQTHSSASPPPGLEAAPSTDAARSEPTFRALPAPDWPPGPRETAPPSPLLCDRSLSLSRVGRPFRSLTLREPLWLKGLR